MDKNLFKKQQPIIIGLAGKAGSGKTSVAESIVPKAGFESLKYGVKWDHIFYALPLYEMASSKKNIQGFHSESRKKYALHDTIYEIYGKSSIGVIPDYDLLIQKVNEIYNLQIEPEGIKPRSFLQKAGDICREGYPDCFCHWAIHKTTNLYRKYLSSLEEDAEENPFCVIISDVRYENEAKSILKMPNGIVIYYSATEETLNNRLLKRDGRLSTTEQSLHSSEIFLDKVRDISSFVIETDDMDIEQQTQETLKLLGLQEKNNA